VHIVGFALKAKTAIVVVANKWDMMGDAPVDEFERRVRRRLRFAPWAAFRAVSAKDGTGVPKLIEEALALCDTREQRIDTPRLNAVVRRAVAERSPPTVHNQQPKFLYVTQPEVRPPTFVFFVSDASLVHFSYRRYLENVLRDQFGFRGVSLQLTFRSRRER
jgi:GTP-binding protein